MLFPLGGQRGTINSRKRVRNPRKRKWRKNGLLVLNPPIPAAKVSKTSGQIAAINECGNNK